MQEDGAITRRGDEARRSPPSRASSPSTARAHHAASTSSTRSARDAKTLAGIDGLTAATYTVRSTITASSAAGDRDRAAGGTRPLRAQRRPPRFAGAEANLRRGRRRSRLRRRRAACEPAWQQALEAARLPLYDVHWPAAMVRRQGADRKAGRDDPGRAQGRPHRAAAAWNAASAAQLKPYDVVHVKVAEARQARRPRRAAHAARPCRARRWCSRTGPAASSPWPAASPIP